MKSRNIIFLLILSLCSCTDEPIDLQTANYPLVFHYDKLVTETPHLYVVTDSKKPVQYKEITSETLMKPYLDNVIKHTNIIRKYYEDDYYYRIQLTDESSILMETKDGHINFASKYTVEGDQIKAGDYKLYFLDKVNKTFTIYYQELIEREANTTKSINPGFIYAFDKDVTESLKRHLRLYPYNVNDTIMLAQQRAVYKLD